MILIDALDFSGEPTVIKVKTTVIIRLFLIAYEYGAVQEM